MTSRDRTQNGKGVRGSPCGVMAIQGFRRFLGNTFRLRTWDRGTWSCCFPLGFARVAKPVRFKSDASDATREIRARYVCHRRGQWSASPGLRIGAKNRRQSAMTTESRREIVELVGEICELSPDVRIGQLLAHLGFLGEDQTARSLWDIDDEQLLEILYQHRAELLGRQSPTPPAVALPRPPAAAAPDTPVQGNG
jgi:hypothetical protein